MTTKPGGASAMASPWLIQTVCSIGISPSSTDGTPSVRVERGAPVLTVPRVLHGSAELLRNELRAVADAEHGDTGVVDRGIGLWRVVDHHRRRAPREDDSLRPLRQHLRQRHRAGHDLGVDVRLAHPSCDQLCVLRPEVDDENTIEGFTGLTGPCRHLGHAGATCPRSAVTGPPSPRPSGTPSASRSPWWPSTCGVRRRG